VRQKHGVRSAVGDDHDRKRIRRHLPAGEVVHACRDDLVASQQVGGAFGHAPVEVVEALARRPALPVLGQGAPHGLHEVAIDLFLGHARDARVDLGQAVQCHR
jgi:hypothetical protein